MVKAHVLHFRWKITRLAVFERFTAWLMWSSFVQNNSSISYTKNMSLSLCLATDQQYATYLWQRRKCAAGCRRSRSDRSSELLPLPVRCSAASCTGSEALETHKHSQRFHLCNYGQKHTQVTDAWLARIVFLNTICKIKSTQRSVFSAHLCRPHSSWCVWRPRWWSPEPVWTVLVGWTGMLGNTGSWRLAAGRRNASCARGTPRSSDRRKTKSIKEGLHDSVGGVRLSLMALFHCVVRLGLPRLVTARVGLHFHRSLVLL